MYVHEVQEGARMVSIVYQHSDLSSLHVCVGLVLSGCMCVTDA